MSQSQSTSSSKLCLSKNTSIVHGLTAFDETVLDKAYSTVPECLHKSLIDARRVVLVANNPSITTSLLDDTLKQGDLVVLFNHFIQADYFVSNELAKMLPKLLSFRQIGDSLLHFGLPPRHNNLPAIEQMVMEAQVGFLFGGNRYQFPTLADDPSPDDDPIDDSVELEISEALHHVLADKYYYSVVTDTHPVVADYPTYEDIHSSAPSSGFLIYRLMLAIKLYMASHHQHELQIVLVGFNTDKKTDYFWHGHNWAFERQEMLDLPDGVSRIKAN